MSELYIPELFPERDEDEWIFAQDQQKQVSFSFRAKTDGQRRIIELSPPAGHSLYGFFDRMTVTSAGLELNRLHMENGIGDIEPAWLITPDDRPNRVDNLFPANTNFPPFVRAPYYGITGRKRVIVRHIPGADLRITCWTIDLEGRGTPGDLFKLSLSFATRTGLCRHAGAFGGKFAFYERLAPNCVPCLTQGRDAGA